MNENEFQNEIASHTGKMLRDAFGKGPQSIHVSMDRPFIIIYLRKFLTQTETILLNQGQVRAIRKTRDIVMSALLPEFKAYLQLLTGMNHLELYYDWELYNQSGAIVAWETEEEEAATAEGPVAQGAYAGMEELHREIGWMSYRIQKRPDRIESRMINKRTLLVVRSGILIDLSKELIRLRDEEHLKQAVRHLEKKYLRDNKYLEQILNSKILDVFVDWDFGRDSSVIVFILSPKA